MKTCMQVNIINTQGISVPGVERKAVAHATHSGPDQAEFSQSRSLDKALKDSDEVRLHEVDRARHLVASVQYPPEEMIDRISNLLARNLGGARE